MKTLKKLVGCRGSWRGENRLIVDPDAQAPDDSKASCRVTPILDGKFVRIDYTWAWKGKRQEGSLLVGRDDDAQELTTDWIDSWHMGGKVMHLRGADAKGNIAVRGSYPAPPGPDWGWRIALEPSSKSLRIVMHNLTPDGREDLAMATSLRRVARG